MLKKKKDTLSMFQSRIQIMITSYSYNDSKWRRMPLSCLKKPISIIKKNNVQISQWFLLSEWASLFCNEKQTWISWKVCQNTDLCKVTIPFKDTKILEFNQYKKFDKALFIIYVDLECLIEKIDGCKNNPENSSTAKVSKHYSIRFFNVYNIVI